MKTITKFIYLGFAPLALACGSIAFAQLPPVDPPDSAAKAAAELPVGHPIEQMVEFETSKSRWHLYVNAQISGFGLVIKGASFQKSPASRFIYVLFDGRLGEIFVPYHDNSHRFLDLTYGFRCLKLNEADFPAPLQIIDRVSSNEGLICKEKRKYLAWMNGENKNPPLVRYGEEVVYFSVLGAANYQYIMEWTFRDDGTILARAGSTGPKYLERRPDVRSKAGHMHDFTWRLDIDLNGAGSDSAYLTSHHEDLTLSDSKATDEKDRIEVEGGFVWNPQNFNTLEIRDSMLENGNLRPTSYELVPMRSGTARHSEDFINKDFWVTRYDPAQMLADYLPTYIQQKQSTGNKDLVIWYTGSEHHEKDSRDEDNQTVPVLWTGFALIPNNLFNRTPFYP
jgi:Cu2+-containing amine oxidase